MRWTAAREVRAVVSDDKPNYTWSDETGLEEIKR